MNEIKQISIDPNCDPEFLARGDELFKLLHDAGETFLILRHMGDNGNLIAEGGAEELTGIIALEGLRSPLVGALLIAGMVRLLRLKPELLEEAVQLLVRIDALNLAIEGQAAANS